MAVLHRGGREERIAEGEAASRKREAREAAEAEANRRAGARVLAEAEEYLLAERKRIEAEAALTEGERTERRFRELERPLSERLISQPARPRGFWQACETVKARWRREAEQERAKQERKNGTLKRRQEWEQAQAAIAAKLDADLRAERERHEQANQRIREGAEDARQKLGERP